MKVTVCGAAGGIGQLLSLLLKLSPYIDELSLYDVVNVPGVAADLSHISSKAKVSSFLAADNGLEKALKGSDFVIIPAGVPRKPGMTRDDLFSINAGIVAQLAEGVASTCPDAFVLVISNPVNSTVPIFAEILKKHGVLNSRKLFGVTTLDSVRASTFLSEVSDLKSETTDVAVIGGHSGSTIVPLFSVASKAVYDAMKPQTREALIHRVQYGGDEVVKAKEGKGSATLSMAYAAYSLTDKLLKAVVEHKQFDTATYIHLADDIEGAKQLKAKINGLEYFAGVVTIGARGVERVKYEVLDRISSQEQEMLAEAVDQLRGNIDKGVNFFASA